MRPFICQFRPAPGANAAIISLMELFIVRHAIAEERSDTRADHERALTKRGRDRFDTCFGALAKELAIDYVLSSPWRRARETAELVAAHSNTADAPRPPIAETELLTAPPSVELYHRILSLEAVRVAVVGHEPWLGELAAELAFGDSELADTLVFKKGGIAWLSGIPEPGGMTIRALLPPRWTLALVRQGAD